MKTCKYLFVIPNLMNLLKYPDEITYVAAGQNRPQKTAANKVLFCNHWWFSVQSQSKLFREIGGVGIFLLWIKLGRKKTNIKISLLLCMFNKLRNECPKLQASFLAMHREIGDFPKFILETLIKV